MAKTVYEMFKESKKRLDAKLEAGEPHAAEIKEYAILQGLCDQYGKDAKEDYIIGEYHKMMSDDAFKNISKDEEERILDGSNMFYYSRKYPSMDEMFKHMSSEAFLDFESRAQRADRINSKGTDIAVDNRDAAIELEKELEKLPADKKKGAGFDLLAEAVHNMTLYGTNKFTKKTYNNDGKQIDSQTNEISRDALYSGMKNIYDVANNVKDISPEAREKVQSFIWRQNMKNAKYLENQPLTAKAKEKLAEERKSREAKLSRINKKLELSEENANKAFDKRKFNFLKKGGTVINAINKYNRATLIGRGKSEYAKIGDVISDFKNKIYNYTELYRADNPKKPVDPQRINDHAKELLKSLNELKKANAAYFEHKRQDGQWRKGTNKNADKRIEAVRGLDEMADSLTEFLQDEIKRNEAKLEKAKEKTKKKEEPKKEEPKKEEPKKEEPKKEDVDIFEEAAKAQEKLKTASARIIPDHNEYTREFAAITAAALVNGSGDDTIRTFTKENYDTMLSTVMEEPTFKDMMAHNNAGTLFRHATADKGQMLFDDYSKARKDNQKFEDIKAEFNANKPENTIKRSNTIAPNTMGKKS